LEDIAVDWRIILNWTLRKLYLRMCIGFVWLRVGFWGQTLLKMVMNLRVPYYSFIHSQALIVQDGPLSSLFGVS
jgi:hypothetical protein